MTGFEDPTPKRHLSGKPGNVRDFTKSRGHVRQCVGESNLVVEKWPKTDLNVSCTFMSVRIFSSIQLVLCVDYGSVTLTA